MDAGSGSGPERRNACGGMMDLSTSIGASALLMGASIVAALAAGSISRLVKIWVGGEDDVLAAHAIVVSPFSRWLSGIIVGALTIGFYIASGVTADAWTLVFFVMLLLAIGLVDLETTFIPDLLSVPLLLGAIAFSPFSEGPYDGAIGAFMGWGAMAATFLAVSARRREMTYSGGDALLAGAGGAVVGAAGVPPFLFLAGFLMLIVFLLPGARDRRIPWGPIICISIALTAATDLGAFFRVQG